ncbi:hypothetical protein PHMEG_00013406 [Phytophthora megakarya]|uniref:Uncharacterized protein n=1 Tax=Phytophthora megakarya TaxID=4795 RepID=A0A225W7B8_9STRA|nr:hypothetical protein PHMEG_00013406 [Phytophthora megakarya]
MRMYQNPTHMLSSGGSHRKFKSKDGSIVMCISYQRQALWVTITVLWDHLRTLFLGLLNVAIVNVFIVHRHYRKVNNRRPPKLFQFLEEVHELLLAVDPSEIFAAIVAATTARERTAPSLSRTQDTQSCAAMAIVEVGHCLEANPDTAEGAQAVKKRHRSCKMCALYKSKRESSRSNIAQSGRMGSNDSVEDGSVGSIYWQTRSGCIQEYELTRSCSVLGYCWHV